MAHIGEVVQSSPFFKETIYLITNNLSDFNTYMQLFLLLIEKYYNYLSFGPDEGGRILNPLVLSDCFIWEVE